MGFFGGGGASASNMVGATSSTAGTAGLVPAPAAGEQNSVLMGDATFLNLDDIQMLPDQVNDCVLWLRSDDLVTSGSNVTTWNNKANSNLNAVQTADATKQPTLVTNQINGHSAVRFDGTNDCLQVASFAIRGEFSAFLVVKQAATNKPLFIEHSANAGSGVNDGFYFYDNPTVNIDRARASALTPSSITWAGTSWTYITYILPSAAQSYMVLKDGLSIGIDGGSNRAGNNNSATDTLNIGSRNNGASLATSADFAEIILYNRPLYHFEISCLHNYLKARYAL